MLKYWPFNKSYLLILSVVIMAFISYQMAFRITFTSWKLHRQLEKQVTHAVDFIYQPDYLERKLANLNTVLKLYHADTVNFRSNAINTIAALAVRNQVKLSAVPVQDVAFSADRFLIQQLNFEGDFFSLNRLLNQLYQVEGIGLIRMVSFKTVRVERNSKVENGLRMLVYLEITK